MNGFNVLRGCEPVRTDGTYYYCAGYIKHLPQRGAIYGIEFSNTKEADLPGFKYYIFCSENAFLNYLTDALSTLEDQTTPKPVKEAPELKNRFSRPNFNVGNPSTYVVSSGEYTADPAIEYPRNIGFQGADYQHDPRPYSNLDGFVDSNNVQYPLYLVVEFGTTKPSITQLDYQIITES